MDRGTDDIDIWRCGTNLAVKVGRANNSCYTRVGHTQRSPCKLAAIWWAMGEDRQRFGTIWYGFLQFLACAYLLLRPWMWLQVCGIAELRLSRVWCDMFGALTFGLALGHRQGSP
eukprot:2638897-Amphidinium_carterae.1